MDERDKKDGWTIQSIDWKATTTEKFTPDFTVEERKSMKDVLPEDDIVSESFWRSLKAPKIQDSKRFKLHFGHAEASLFVD